MKDKLDESELDDKFLGFTQSIGDKYREVAETVKAKYADSDLDEKFAGLRQDLGDRFTDFKAAFLGARDDVEGRVADASENVGDAGEAAAEETAE